MPHLAELPIFNENGSAASLLPSGRASATTTPLIIDQEFLRQSCLDSGADDIGFVGIARPELDQDRSNILNVFPETKTLISLVIRMNREPIRSPARSIANLEFHHAGDQVNNVGRQIVKHLESKGIRAVNPAMGFPMEMERFPGKIWVVSHKRVAVAAGMGKMGIHRTVIHPRFGSFILLGTILVDAQVSATASPLDFNPCMECKLCVAACPVGAIGQDGHFNFSACYTHNYREFMGGFTDWVENIAESQTAKQYGKKVTDAESSSMWQSLSYGANYKAAYCIAVCPAGEDVLSPFKTNRKAYIANIVKPLQQKEETIYVVAGSDAEEHVAKRFPHKTLKRVGNSLRPQSVKGFLEGLPLVFQKNKAEGLMATYHLTFTGKEPKEATVIIQNKTLQVLDGHQGEADFRLTADSQTWLRFLAKDWNLLWEILKRKVRIKGPLRLLQAFSRCFPR